MRLHYGISKNSKLFLLMIVVDPKLHIIGTRLVSTDTLTIGISVRYRLHVFNNGHF
jgi:hypothetical protein